MADVRDLREGDHAAVGAVAVACDQIGPVSASDPRYLAHIRSRGRVAVREESGSVVGYGGVVDLRGTSFLTDLFVAPAARGTGHGGALLEVLWGGRATRATSSSQDPRALAAYARFGAIPRWPLVRLRLPGASVVPQVPVVHEAVTPGDAGWTLELDGTETVHVLAGPRDVAATAVVRREGDRWTVLRATTPDPRGLAVLVADLIHAGARIVDVDLWCATPDAVDLVDPTHELPSPALA